VRWYDRELGRVARLRDEAARLLAVRAQQQARGHHAKAAATGQALGAVRHRLFGYAHVRVGKRWLPGLTPVQRTAFRALMATSRWKSGFGYPLRGRWRNPWPE
jgi:hypothetical protein